MAMSRYFEDATYHFSDFSIPTASDTETGYYCKISGNLIDDERKPSCSLSRKQALEFEQDFSWDHWFPSTEESELAQDISMLYISVENSKSVDKSSASPSSEFSPPACPADATNAFNKPQDVPSKSTTYDSLGLPFFLSCEFDGEVPKLYDEEINQMLMECQLAPVDEANVSGEGFSMDFKNVNSPANIEEPQSDSRSQYRASKVVRTPRNRSPGNRPTSRTSRSPKRTSDNQPSGKRTSSPSRPAPYKYKIISPGRLITGNLCSEDANMSYKCLYCSKNHTSRRLYEIHMRKTHGHKNWTCNICHGKVARTDYQSKHIASERHTKALVQMDDKVDLGEYILEHGIFKENTKAYASKKDIFVETP